jgi:alpha-mannosidase
VSATVQVTHIKPAEDGDGVILRLHETAGQAVTAELQLGSPTSVERCDMLERSVERVPLSGATLRIAMAANGWQTLRVRGAGVLAGDGPVPYRET